jgi:SGNH hydrolase-like domain, acetyltransferase AlgX
MSPPPDPIDYGIRPEDNRLGHRAAVALTGAFILLIALPGLLREFSADSIRDALAQIFHSSEGTVVDRLRAAEKRVDDGAWTKPIRQQVQTVLYTVFREGNRKVLVGRDGWLFHRPGIRALTGRGPVLGPTHSVAKDHTLKNWEGPIPVIREFAEQLKARGIQFVIVPVPDKAHASPERAASAPVLWMAELGYAMSREEVVPLRQFGLLGSRNRFVTILADLQGMAGASIQMAWGMPVVGEGLRHPDALAGYDRIGESDARVLTTMSLAKLRTDSHGTPDTMRQAARLTAAQGVAAFGFEYLQVNSVAKFAVRDRGDLTQSLGVSEHISTHLTEEVTGSQAPLVNGTNRPDPTSPIVLLGDSNVNMYDDPSLPFCMPGAGFGSWLSAYLGRSLHIIAINGGGATAVRQRFAALPDDVVRAKKVVIWVIAERDLFMDPAVARENEVEWKRVTFNPNRSQPADAVPAGVIVVDVTLKTKSALQSLAGANYPDAVYVAECTVDTVVTGTYAPSEVAVVLWNFRQRQIQPSARFGPGQRLRLTLVPWESKGELTKTNLSDDLQRFDLPLLYAEKAEPR